MRKLAPAVALLLCIASSCKRRSEDEEARARIFSPEQPVGSLAQAREPIDATRLADDPALAERVLHMPQAEVEARLGPHKAEQRVQFAWFRGPGLPDGGSEVSLEEETTLLQGPGGDFSVRLANDHNQGFELVWAAGRAYVKGLYGAFHERRTDRTDVQRIREQALSGLSTFDRLARGLKLKLAGQTTAKGRRAVRYTVDGYGARAARAEKGELPKIEYPVNAQGQRGPDPDTARRLELWEKEEPTDVSGTLIVDAETGAPLDCDLQGHFRVPSAGDAGPAAELALHSTLVSSGVGQDPGVRAPAVEPEPTAPHAVKDPLRFLGKEPGAAPGPASTAEPEEGGADDEEEAPDEAPAEPGKPAASERSAAPGKPAAPEKSRR